MYNAWLRDPASVHAVSNLFVIRVARHWFSCDVERQGRSRLIWGTWDNRFVINFVLVVGRLFPQQLIFSTSFARSSSTKPRFGFSVRWHITSSLRWSWACAHWKPGRRQIDWWSFGCASYHQKLSGNNRENHLCFTQKGFAAGKYSLINICRDLLSFILFYTATEVLLPIRFHRAWFPFL